jgi:hypothetical protein
MKRVMAPAGPSHPMPKPTFRRELTLQRLLPHGRRHCGCRAIRFRTVVRCHRPPRGPDATRIQRVRNPLASLDTACLDVTDDRQHIRRERIGPCGTRGCTLGRSHGQIRPVAQNALAFLCC